jgi:trehalose 6-phosphate phosphatase
VACDYDGTMAPIVANPDDARPLTESRRRIRRAGRAAVDHRRR